MIGVWKRGLLRTTGVVELWGESTWRDGNRFKGKAIDMAHSEGYIKTEGYERVIKEDKGEV